MDRLFFYSNLLVLPFWLLMILLPHWRWSRLIMSSLWTVVPAAALYGLLVVPNLAVLLPQLANPTLASVAALLGTEQFATIAWVHFLAFDLFAGRWAYLDSRQRGLPAWLVSPALIFVLMVGPLGLLIYLLIRALVSPRLEPAQAH
ncbi:MAG: DUF4281 domain-containing protein [Caldilineaceae bacterium]|nr:DUF4281 domain-containing protein [Caldilineaceae bacterium]